MGTHDLDHRREEVGKEGLLYPEEAPPPDGPAEKASQDVTPTLVRRQDPVGDHEGNGPQVVRYDTDGHIPAGVRAVVVPGHVAGPADKGKEEVRLEIGTHPLHDRGKPFQPHPRVDVLLGKRHQFSFFVPVVLHEDKIPYFQVAVAVAADLAVRLSAGKGGTLVVDDLGTGTAWADRPDGPEVVILAHPDDPFFREADNAVPDLESLVVVKEDGRR